MDPLRELSGRGRPSVQRTQTLVAEAILFDLDGVLVDSTAEVERVWRNFAVRHHLDPDELLIHLHGRRMIDIIRAALPDLTPGELRAESDRVERTEARLGASARPQPGALALVASLADVPWAIVTSGSSLVAESRLTATGLARPRVIVTADDVRSGKPSPLPYVRAAEELSVDPRRCIVVEDAPAGIAAGRAAGATVVGVTTSHGLDEVAAADHVVADTSSLRRATGSGLRLQIIELGHA